MYNHQVACFVQEKLGGKLFIAIERNVGKPAGIKRDRKTKTHKIDKDLFNHFPVLLRGLPWIKNCHKKLIVSYSGQKYELAILTRGKLNS